MIKNQQNALKTCCKFGLLQSSLSDKMLLKAIDMKEKFQDDACFFSAAGSNSFSRRFEI